MLTFDQLKTANKERCENAFHHSVDDWSVEKWTIAFSGEAGEVCNAVKKLIRHFEGNNVIDPKDERDDAARQADLEYEIAMELADTIIYADLLATKLNIRLEDAVRVKFNHVSDLRQSNIKLE